MEKDSYGQCGAKIPNSEVGFKSVGNYGCEDSYNSEIGVLFANLGF